MNGSPHHQPKQYAQAYMIVYVSKDGQNDWHPLMWTEVPEWVKHPDNMARLADGEMCQDPTQGATGSSWYKAERVEAPKEIKVLH